MSNDKYPIGYEIVGSEYTEVAMYCNEKGDRTIEEVDGKYIVKATPAPTNEDILKQKRMKLSSLEQQYIMPRYLRDMILDHPEDYDEVVVNHATEIEKLAEEIRNN